MFLFVYFLLKHGLMFSYRTSPKKRQVRKCTQTQLKQSVRVAWQILHSITVALLMYIVMKIIIRDSHHHKSIKELTDFVSSILTFRFQTTKLFVGIYDWIMH